MFEKVPKSVGKVLDFPVDFCVYTAGQLLYRINGTVHPLRAFLQRAVLQAQFKECIFILGEVADGLQIVRFGLGKVPDLQSITPCPVVHGNLLATVPGVIIKAINGAHHMAVNG